MCIIKVCVRLSLCFFVFLSFKIVINYKQLASFFKTIFENDKMSNQMQSHKNQLVKFKQYVNFV